MESSASTFSGEELAFVGDASVYPRTAVKPEVEQMRAAIAGDAAAMRSIYEREAPRLLRRLGHLCGDASHAQDLLQECFTRAFAGEVSFAGTSTTAAFLHGIALNLWRNELRKQTRRRWLLRLRGSSVEPQALPAASAQQEHDELQQRLAGYQVQYEYRGQSFTALMPQDPGPRIQVRVSVAPLAHQGR